MNKMKQQKAGSAIVIIMIVLSAVTIVCLNLYNSCSLTIELAFKRQKQQQRICIVQGIFNYGFFLCSEQFEAFIAESQTIKINCGIWAVEGLPTYKAYLEIKPNPKFLTINVSLFDTEKNELVFEKKRILNRKQEKNKKPYFVVSNEL